MHDLDQRARPRRPRRRWVLGAALAVVALVTVAVPVAWATNVFSDVPTSSPHHDDINTIARVGVTGGCAPGLYCPSDPVRRDQMASFIARTMRALTPIHRTATQSLGGIDLDAGNTYCSTAGFTPTVAAVARVDVWLSLASNANATMGFATFPRYSTNGGTTWNFVGGGNFARAASHVTTEFGFASHVNSMALTPGTTYNFGTWASRDSGAPDPGDGRCTTFVTITYADAGAGAVGSGLGGASSSGNLDTSK